MPAKSLRVYLIGALVLAAVVSVVGEQVGLAVPRLAQLRTLPLRGRPVLQLAPRRPAGAPC